jgi:RNA polymerase sigma-70 factor (ECF subfamily)
VTDSAATFQAQRRRLLGLAYRLLGAASDAEDVVQDAYLRWSAADPDSVHDPTAWLTTVVNLCRNRLTSARARRERYVGTWLLEPVLTGDETLGPLETAEQRDSVSLALLTLLEQLTPRERAVFVLHESFGYRLSRSAGLSGPLLMTDGRRGRAAPGGGGKARDGTDPGDWRHRHARAVGRAAAHAGRAGAGAEPPAGAGRARSGRLGHR